MTPQEEIQITRAFMMEVFSKEKLYQKSFRPDGDPNSAKRWLGRYVQVIQRRCPQISKREIGEYLWRAANDLVAEEAAQFVKSHRWSSTENRWIKKSING